MDKTNPAPRHFSIPDLWLTAHKHVKYIDFDDIANGEWSVGDLIPIDLRTRYMQLVAFHRSGILINFDGQEAANSIAQIVGVLDGDVPDYVQTWHLGTNIVHPLRFKRIYLQGTEARGIKIVGQGGNE